MQLLFVTDRATDYTKPLGRRVQLPGNVNHEPGLRACLAAPFSIPPQNLRLITLTAMPHRRSSVAPAKSRPQKRSFRQRYDELEVRRAELSARLHLLGEAAQRHPGYKRALKLLNDIYRKEKLAQRLAVLQAAAWLIDVLEKLVSTM